MSSRAMTCNLCEDTGWVCENHADTPWDGLHLRRRWDALPHMQSERSQSSAKAADRHAYRIRQEGLASLVGMVTRIRRSNPTPGGEKLFTLRDAATYIASLLKKESRATGMAGRDRGAEQRPSGAAE